MKAAAFIRRLFKAIAAKILSGAPDKEASFADYKRNVCAGVSRDFDSSKHNGKSI